MNFLLSIFITFLLPVVLLAQEDSQTGNNDSDASIISSDDRSISPTIEIRYDDFVNEMTPSSTIGILLKIDDNRFTGFDVNTATDETRILIGWKWSVLGISVKEITVDDEITHVNMYSFGVKYNIIDNMNTTIEYVLSGDDNTPDFLRLAIGVQF